MSILYDHAILDDFRRETVNYCKTIQQGTIPEENLESIKERHRKRVEELLLSEHPKNIAKRLSKNLVELELELLMERVQY